MHKKLTTILLTLIISIQLPIVTLAQQPKKDSSTASQTNNTNSTTTENNVPDTFKVSQYLTIKGQNQKANITEFIIDLINFLSIIIGSIAILALIGGGITLVASAGQENLVQKGKDIIKYSIIGVIVALSSFYIVQFIQTILYAGST